MNTADIRLIRHMHLQKTFQTGFDVHKIKRRPLKSAMSDTERSLKVGRHVELEGRSIVMNRGFADFLITYTIPNPQTVIF